MALQISTINGDNSNRSGPKMSSTGDEGKLFVGALSKDTTEESLRAYFSIYGDVIESKVKYDPLTKRPRGFGFIQFQDPSSAQKVLDEGPHVIDGKKVDPKKAAPMGKQPMGNSARTKKIFVGGLKPDTPADIVQNYFSQYGTVVEVDLVKEKETNRRRGFCFVEFDREEIVDMVLQKQYHDLAEGIKVEVKAALTKEQQAAKKAQEMGGYRAVGRGMVGGYGYPGVPTYGPQYSAGAPTVLYSAPDPTGAAGYSMGYAGYGPPAASPYGIQGYEVQTSPAFAAVRYPEVSGRGYGGASGNPAAGANRFHPYAR